VIKINFVLNDEEDFQLLFNGFVRPHLCVWWSAYLKDTECLEKVQCRATKLPSWWKVLNINCMKRDWRREELEAVNSSLLNYARFRQSWPWFVFKLDNGGGHALQGHKWK